MHKPRSILASLPETRIPMSLAIFSGDASSRWCIGSRWLEWQRIFPLLFAIKSLFAVDKLHHTVGEWCEFVYGKRECIAVEKLPRCTSIRIFFRNENVASQKTREGAVERELNELELFSIQVQIASCCDLDLLVASLCSTEVWANLNSVEV